MKQQALFHYPGWRPAYMIVRSVSSVRSEAKLHQGSSEKQRSPQSPTQGMDHEIPRPFLMRLINPLVDESWSVISRGDLNSGMITLAICLPSSTPH
uniref:Uncharacterized protein n=1 Tax=Candidatus Kentrum sp. LFY TaxID=2126342 RepID=A0A450U7Q5_9GAMM|nr:MAG: hypothetical protein BECKLFY1418B_GA0070995_100836 [Candidatus Kentron sp. LFY]